MNIKKDTCWYREVCHEEMIKGADGTLWPVLEESGHWPVLKELIDTIPKTRIKRKLLDIGCGGGALGSIKMIKKRFCYTGVDLPKVIINVAKKVNPDNTYLQHDLTSGEGLSFIAHYDVVVMNAFIDIMQHALDMLYDISDKCTNYVIIHRQFITNGSTRVKTQGSYGGYTFISYINKVEFNRAMAHFKLVKRLETGLGKDNYSFLFKRFKS